MSRAAVLTVEARDDLRAAVFAAARRLGDRPLLGRRDLALLPEPYRFWSLTRFQVVLVYNAGTDPPRILRILGTARDFAPLLAHIAAPPTDPQDRSGRSDDSVGLLSCPA